MDERITCTLCPHGCRLASGQEGICHARANRSGSIECINYGMATSLALDPIEKKPINRYRPGTYVLSYGSWGCNLRCPFCQNCSISIDFAQARAHAERIAPEELVSQALSLRSHGNIGIAFTYNEPTVSFEYLMDTAILAHKTELSTVLVTNGYLNEEPWRELMRVMDAVNVDLKGATQAYYDGLGAPGGLKVVKRSIGIAARMTHVEVSTLVVPDGPGGLYKNGPALPGNDTDEEIEEIAAWISSVSPDIPLHLQAFYPRWRLSSRQPESWLRVRELAQVAQRHLRYVYA